MSLIRYIRDIDRKFAWSFLGVVLALMFGGIMIYGEFFADSNPRIRYDILTSTPVLDVREDVSKLSILFDGMDIRQQKKSISVVTVRVVNDSERDILKVHYDENDPLGLHVSTGKIIRFDLLTASNPYLERQLVPRQQDDSTLLFPSVILEAKEFFIVKLLLLHPEDKQPDVTAVGKIAGIRTIPVAEAYKHEATPSFLLRTFAGGLFVQAFRLLAYSIGTALFLVALIVPSVYIGSKVSERKRRKIVDEFKETATLKLRDEDEFFFKTYTQEGGGSLMSMLSLISNNKTLQSAYEHRNEYKDRKSVVGRAHLDLSEMDHVRGIWFYSHTIDECLEAGLIKETDKGLVVDEHMKETLERFVEFLIKKRAFPERGTLTVLNRELANKSSSSEGKEKEKDEQSAQPDK